MPKMKCPFQDKIAFEKWIRSLIETDRINFWSLFDSKISFKNKIIDQTTKTLIDVLWTIRGYLTKKDIIYLVYEKENTRNKTSEDNNKQFNRYIYEKIKKLTKYKDIAPIAIKDNYGQEVYFFSRSKLINYIKYQCIKEWGIEIGIDLKTRYDPIEIPNSDEKSISDRLVSTSNILNFENASIVLIFQVSEILNPNFIKPFILC